MANRKDRKEGATIHKEKPHEPLKSPGLTTGYRGCDAELLQLEIAKGGPFRAIDRNGFVLWLSG